MQSSSAFELVNTGQSNVGKSSYREFRTSVQPTDKDGVYESTMSSAVIRQESKDSLAFNPAESISESNMTKRPFIPHKKGGSTGGKILLKQMSLFDRVIMTESQMKRLSSATGTRNENGVRQSVTKRLDEFVNKKTGLSF